MTTIRVVKPDYFYCLACLQGEVPRISQRVNGKCRTCGDAHGANHLPGSALLARERLREETKAGELEEGREALRAVLRSLRWDDQGGYVEYNGDGRWGSTLCGITQDQQNALFNMAGIEPDVIVRLGSCSTCRFAVDGRERGWVEPCISCNRPKMSNYERQA